MNIDITDLCEKTAKGLYEAYDNLKTGKGKLIFPTYSGGEVRISEQEARFILCQKIIESNNIPFYSVETPTKHKYKFGDQVSDITKTESGRSGCIDVSLYCDKQYDGEYKHPELNIELKAHNPDDHAIAKDLFKLMHESSDGLFFHLLEKTDHSTLCCNTTQKGVLTKIHNSFFKLDWSKLNNSPGGDITFAICSLEPQLLLMKKRKKTDLMNISEVFDDNSPFFIGYDIDEKNRKVSFKPLNSWK